MDRKAEQHFADQFQECPERHRRYAETGCVLRGYSCPVWAEWIGQDVAYRCYGRPEEVSRGGAACPKEPRRSSNTAALLRQSSMRSESPMAPRYIGRYTRLSCRAAALAPRPNLPNRRNSSRSISHAKSSRSPLKSRNLLDVCAGSSIRGREMPSGPIPCCGSLSVSGKSLCSI